MKNYRITVNGNVYEVTVEENAAGAAAAAAPKTVSLPAPEPVSDSGAGNVKITAPMPGKILAVKTSAGQTVKKGQVIMVLEAMKMENDIVAPQDGIIAAIHAAVGDSVESGATLAALHE